MEYSLSRRAPALQRKPLGGRGGASSPPAYANATCARACIHAGTALRDKRKYNTITWGASIPASVQRHVIHVRLQAAAVATSPTRQPVPILDATSQVPPSGRNTLPPSRATCLSAQATWGAGQSVRGPREAACAHACISAGIALLGNKNVAHPYVHRQYPAAQRRIIPLRLQGDICGWTIAQRRKFAPGSRRAAR